VVDALASDQLISILAEPNLTAQSGEVASFLAGGEFPVPIAASPLNNTITIEYKQFGVSLAFVPTVLGPDRLNLRVRPEVSELSENGAISLPLGSGVVRIPALSVRRAETTVELGSGQSFAIAGLLQRNNTMVNSGVNGLRDLPVLGALFGSDRYRRNETELVIIITPYLVRPVSDPQALAAPTDGFRPATDLDRILFRRQLARGAPGRAFRSGVDAGFILE
jgi:pilus assembly protein CpaC